MIARLNLLILVAMTAVGMRVGATETTAQIRFDSCKEWFDTNEAVVLLERELRASVAHTISLSVVAPSSAWDGVDLSIAVVCEAGEQVSVLVSRRRGTPSEAAAGLSLSSIPLVARARLVALSSAETARFLITEAAAVAPLPATLSAPLPAVRTLRHAAPRVRLLRGLAFGLGTLTVASVIVGAVLATSISPHDHGHHGGDLDEIGPGIAFGVGGLGLVGTSVDVGLWMRERNSPIPSTLPSAGVSRPLLEISF